MTVIDELERLQALRERGALNEEEFQRAKARVLGGAGPAGGTLHEGAHEHAPGAFLRSLARSRTDRYLGGVCGGLGRHTEAPAWVWRLIFCLVTLYFGAGALFYLLLWLFLPLEPL